MSDSFQKLSLGSQVDKAAEFCTYCPRLCRFTCPIAEVEHRETTTPWGLMRLLEYARHGSVDFDSEVAEVFYHCTGCGACQSLCKHDIDIPRAVWKARSLGVENDAIPEALDGFVDFFKEETHPHQTTQPLDPKLIADIFDQDASVAFFPDCETRRYQPELIFRLGRALEILLGHKVHLSTRLGNKGSGCCGFPLSAAGDNAAFTDHCTSLEYDHLGFDIVYTDCASFAAISENDTFGYKVKTHIKYIPSYLSGVLNKENIVKKIDLKDTFLHDGCFSTRHLNADDDIRKLLNLIADEYEEFSTSRHDAPCCGGGSHYHVIAEDFSNQCATVRLEQLAREDGKKIVTAGQTCAKQLNRVGGKATSLLSLICDAMGIESFESKV